MPRSFLVKKRDALVLPLKIDMTNENTETKENEQPEEMSESQHENVEKTETEVSTKTDNEKPKLPGGK